ncbi:ATP-binding protein [Halanaerobacter jeridensis]|uniref:Anti-sigma regulatory factor (Ser/Thr protein kinase) n=1 Tax=Halanaerobacter jeridensis TaxID=706427 RepID=A0A938XRL3_9FIRM|nr:ATP-binding protein [Halanaerobacter jeridensis]MBM7556165.1 anti-sigma regulatory factor (Ser/Thr protein kinase) [Halanaerobacter jeridensis]
MGSNADSKEIINAEVEAGDFSSGGEISSKLKDLLRKLGTSSKLIRKIAIITYELEMNIIIHSEGGSLAAEVNPGRIDIIARDEGPGIEDVDKAFKPGYSTASESVREMGFGAGMGLCNIKNYADNLEVESELGVGTTIRASIDLK